MGLKKITTSLILCILTVAHVFAANGKAGDNVRWELNNNGVLTFTGLGEMKNFGAVPYRPQLVRSVVINEGITTIGANAFKNCVNLTDVTLPPSLKQIGTKAFAGCKRLTSVNLPDGVLEIGKEAFKDCKNLAIIRIPVTVNSIGVDAFLGCFSIGKIIELPDFLTVNTAKNYGLNLSLVDSYWNSRYSDMAVADVPKAKQDKTATDNSAPQVPTSDVDIAIPYISTQNDKTFALIISNENYANMEDVPFALNDGNIFRNYCEHTLGIPANNIIHYSDASSGTMREALSELKMANRIVGSDMKVIFYYSGHGAPDPATKEGYLIPVDARRVNPEVCLPLTKLYETLGDLDVAMTTVFLDACFSGGERNGGVLLADNGERAVKIKQKASAPKGRMVVFSATDGDETALPYKGKGHGIFTYFLLKKLKESAGSTSLSELADYIKSNVTSTAF